MTLPEDTQLPELLPSWSRERVLQLLDRAAVAVDQGNVNSYNWRGCHLLLF